MNILFVGNSYTYYNDMPKLFEALAKENGYTPAVFSVTKGGRFLSENLDPCDENGKKILDISSENEIDVLFLQEQSCAPINAFDRFLLGTKGLYERVKAKRTVLYATWGRKEGCEKLKSLSLSSGEMTDKLFYAYTKAAEEIGAEISPAGLCFKYLSERYPEIELYNPDLSHPSYLGSALAALCHYVTVFASLPSSTDSLGLDKDTLSALMEAVQSKKTN